MVSPATKTNGTLNMEIREPITKIIPSMDLMLVELLPAVEKSPGGILLPDGERMDSYRQGIVRAVGPGKWFTPSDATGFTNGFYIPVVYPVGSRLLLDFPATMELGRTLIGDKPHVLCREENVLAVLE